MGSLVSLQLRHWPGVLLSVPPLGLDCPLLTGVAHMASGLNLTDSIRQHQMGAVDSSDPGEVRRAGEFREGFTLKVGLTWSHGHGISHGHGTSKGQDNTVWREIRLEGKAE